MEFCFQTFCKIQNVSYQANLSKEDFVRQNRIVVFVYQRYDLFHVSDYIDHLNTMLTFSSTQSLEEIKGHISQKGYLALW